MPWFKVDDGFHGHPKVDMLSPASVGIWTLCGSHCAQYLTDGKVFARTVRKFGGTDAEIAELVDAGLWIDNEDGTYQFKDWEDYQPMRADVEAKRDAARERMKRVRSARDRSQDVRANTSRTSREVRSTPTRPDPTHIKGVPADAERGSLSPEHRATDEAYQATGKAFNFIAARSIAKWLMHERHFTGRQVTDAMIAVHRAGRPITKQSMDQQLTQTAGHTAPRIIGQMNF